MSHIFGARAIITDPEEGNEEWQGRVCLLLNEIPPDDDGRRFQVGIEGVRGVLQFSLRELTVQDEPPTQRTVNRVVKQRPTAQAVNAAALRLMKHLLRELEDANPSPSDT